MSFHDVCHFVSNLPATDRRQKIVRQQNRRSGVNKAVTLVRKVDGGCQHDKLKDERVSTCACFQNLEKKSYKVSSKTEHAKKHICTNRHALRLHDFVRRSSDSPAEPKYIFFKNVIVL